MHSPSLVVECWVALFRVCLEGSRLVSYTFLNFFQLSQVTPSKIKKYGKYVLLSCGIMTELNFYSRQQI